MTIIPAIFSEKPLSRVFQLVCIFAPLIIPVRILLNLDRGIDFSDAGYYLLVVSNLAEIERQIPQTGTVWGLLPLPQSIFINRLVLFVFLNMSALFLITAIGKLTSHHSFSTMQEDFLERIPIFTLAIGLVNIQYFYWMPDPSYNSVTFVLNMLVVAISLIITANLKYATRLPKRYPFFLGFSFLLLLLSRPPTGLLLGPILGIFILIVARPPINTVLRLIALFIGGALAAMFLITIFVETPAQTFTRFAGGMTLDFETGKGIPYMLDRTYASLKEILRQYWIPTIILLSAVFINGVGQRFLSVNQALKISTVIFSVGIFSLLFLFSTTLAEMEKPRLLYFGGTAFLIGILTILSCFVGFLNKAYREYCQLSAISIAIMPVLALAAFAQIIFTNNNWVSASGNYALFVILPLIIAAAPGGKWRLSPISISALSVVLILQATSWENLSTRPYRLFSPLAAQTIPTEIRGGSSTIKTDHATHETLNALTAGATGMGPMGQRPILLDMTGRLPLVNYHLGASISGTPWLLSGYPGSEKLFQWAVQRLSQDELENAWILTAPKYKRRHKEKALNKRGRNIKRDYVEVVRTHSAYLKTDIVLLMPKNYSLSEK